MLKKLLIILISLIGVIGAGTVAAVVYFNSGNNEQTSSSSSNTSETSATTKNCTISFNTLYYAVSYEPITGVVGSSLSLPQPEREGYEFLGWYKDPSYKKIFLETKYPESNCTLYAKWEVKEYTIYYDLFGTGNYDSVILKYGDSIDYPIPTVSGYYFVGWYENGLVFLDTTMPGHDVHLVGTWRAVDYEYTYVLNDGENNPNNKTQYSVEDKDNTILTPTRYGYTFEGWYTEDKFVNRVYTYPLFNTSLYAKWSKNHHKVILNTEYGDLIQKEYDYYFGETVTLPTLSRGGMNFLGWYLGDTLSENTFVMLDGEVELNAKWEYIEYDINYYLNGGNFETEPLKKYNIDTNPKLSKPVKEGYDFIGWYLDENLEIPLTKLNSGNISVYAKFQIKQYNIEFDYGYNNITDKITQDYGTSVTLPSPARTGFEFLGWYDEKTDTKIETLIVPSNNVKLIGKWGLAKYTVTFNVGSSVAFEEVEFGSGVTFPDYTRTGYTFLGWYIGKDSVSSEGFIMPAYDVEITAKYEVITYKATYDLSIGTATNTNLQSYDVTDNLELIDPTAVGYEFEGWYLIEEDKETKVTSLPLSDCTLKAKWNLIHYTISYDYSGKGISSKLVTDFTILDTVNLPTIARDACDFGGWYYLEEGKVKLISSIPAGTAKNIELHAIEHEYFVVSGSKITGITDYGVEKFGDGLVTFPSSIDGKAITEIGELNFDSEILITMVKISKGIKVIDEKAFNNWTNLESILIPGSITSIGANAFRNTKLTELDLSSIYTTTLDEGALQNIPNLEILMLPSPFYSFSNLVVGDNKLKQIIIDMDKYDFEKMMDNNFSGEKFNFGSTADYEIVLNDDTKFYKDKSCEVKFEYTFTEPEYKTINKYIYFPDNNPMEIILPSCSDPDYYYRYSGRYRSLVDGNYNHIYFVDVESIYTFEPYSAYIDAEMVSGYTTHTVKLFNTDGAFGFSQTTYEVNNVSETIYLPLLFKKLHVSRGFYTSPTFEEDTLVSEIKNDIRESMYLYCKWECIYRIEGDALVENNPVYEIYRANYLCDTNNTLYIYPYTKEDGTTITKVGGNFHGTYDIIRIEDGITEIKSQAFNGIQVDEIYLPSSITKIEHGGFHPSASCTIVFDGTLKQFKNKNMNHGSFGYNNLTVVCNDQISCLDDIYA